MRKSMTLCLAYIVMAACGSTEMTMENQSRAPVPLPELSLSASDRELSIDALRGELDELIASLREELSGYEEAFVIDEAIETILGHGDSMIVTTGSERASEMVARAYLLVTRIAELGVMGPQ